MKIRVVHKRPGKLAEIVSIENTLEALQGLLDGGYLEAVHPPNFMPLGAGIHAYVDEEGKLKNLPPNFALSGDVIVGPVIFSKSDAEGEEVGLDESEAAEVCALLNE